jgi:DNA-directed RNA polymerase specialized sigma24 family protein
MGFNCVARNKAAELLKAGRRRFYDGLPDERSLDEKVNGPDGDPIPFIDLLRLEDDVRRAFPDRSDEELADLRLDLRPVIDRLPGPQRQMCEQLQSQTVTEYSRSVGKPTGTVQKQILKVRSAFADAGLRTYHPGTSV